MKKVRPEKPLEMDLGFNRKTGERMVRIVEFPEWPPSWSVLVGELGHNLRSALDHLVFQLATDAEKNRTAFPISLTEDAYLRPRGRDRISYRDQCLVGVDPRWAATIDDLQPFKLDPQYCGGPLAILNELSNRDKHRVGLPILSRVETPFAFITVERNNCIRSIELRAKGAGDDMTLQAQVTAPEPQKKEQRLIYGFKPKRRPDSSSGIEIVFGHREITIPQLGGLVTALESILGDFQPAFGPSSGSH
jgi:hypothetical protein